MNKAEITKKAIEVFADESAALIWLKRPNAALNGNSPISLLDTESGSSDVLHALARIEQGVSPFEMDELADAAKRAADRSIDAIDSALDFVDKSNIRIAKLEKSKLLRSVKN